MTAGEALATRLTVRLPEIESAILTRIEAVANPDVDDADYLIGLRESVRVAVRYALRGLERGPEEAGPPPAALLDQVRMAARNGVGLDTAAGGGGSMTLDLSNCAVEDPQHCEATEVAPWETETELIEVAGTTYEKFVPKKGSTFGELEFRGPECILDELTAPIEGALAGLPPQGTGTVNRLMSFSTSSNSAAGVELTLSGSPAQVLGEVVEHLDGSHEGSTWRSVWEETHGGWQIHTVEGVAFGSPEHVQISGGPQEFGFEPIPGFNISATCSETSAEGAWIAPGGTESLNGLTFSGCEVEDPVGCEFHNNSIVFNDVFGSLDSNEAVTFTPASGNTFSEILFEGEGCSVEGLVFPLTGSFTGIGPDLHSPHLGQPLNFSRATDHFGFAGGVASLTGTIEQRLDGVFAAEPWGVY